MDLTRRQFATRMTVVGAFVASAWCGLKASRPVRMAAVVCTRLFPGRVVPMDHDRVKKRGPWAG